MTRWNWQDAIYASCHHGAPAWLGFLSAVAPWVTAAILFAMILVTSTVWTAADGAMFALPDKGVGDISDTDAVAMAMPSTQGTLVFFDDTRYMLDDDAQVASFARQLKERVAQAESPVLLVLADKRVSGGDFMRIAAVAKANGVAKVLFAERGSK